VSGIKVQWNTESVECLAKDGTCVKMRLNVCECVALSPSSTLLLREFLSQLLVVAAPKIDEAYALVALNDSCSAQAQAARRVAPIGSS
jgi:hypothetical protein